MFGGMNVETIFRDLEREMRTGGLRGGFGGNSGGGSTYSNEAFRPFFHS